mmetsp:Transcript_67458/g.180232  ORF Transcript_67458/g.180232 Transcript_67458/m.180232 type:complete len:211 (-) Transcript_67458:210-842(-)
MLLQEVKSGQNVQLYRETLELIGDKLGPPDQLRDNEWMERTQELNEKTLEKLEVELCQHKLNSIKEKVRRLNLSYLPTFALRSLPHCSLNASTAILPSNEEQWWIERPASPSWDLLHPQGSRLRCLAGYPHSQGTAEAGHAAVPCTRTHSAKARTLSTSRSLPPLPPRCAWATTTSASTTSPRATCRRHSSATRARATTAPPAATRWTCA